MGRKMAIIERAGRKKSLKEKTPKSGSKVKKKRSVHGTTPYVTSARESRHSGSVPAVGVMDMAQTFRKRGLKTTRYEIRFTSQQQEMMEKASRILGYKNATDYIRHVMQESATKVIKGQLLLQIAEQDQQRFMEELVTPSEPSEAFKKGVALLHKTLKD